MKLHAFSILHEGFDLKETIIWNRHHVDRWILVVPSSEVPNFSWCVDHNVELLPVDTHSGTKRASNTLPKSMPESSSIFDSLDPDSWLMLVDGGTVLPRYFRERLEALPLLSDCLYLESYSHGCESMQLAHVQKSIEPWIFGKDGRKLDSRCLRMFYLSSSSGIMAAEALQAGRFDDQNCIDGVFPSERTNRLPLPVLRVEAAPWNRSNGSMSLCSPQSILTNSFPVLLDRVTSEYAQGSAAIIGYYPGGRAKEVASRFSKVFLIDRFDVHSSGGSELIEADRNILRSHWINETNSFAGVCKAGSCECEGIDMIPDHSLDALYIPGEVDPNWCAVHLPQLIQKVREGGVVIGDLFGVPYARGMTFAISLLLGLPDEIKNDGSWMKRIVAERRPRHSSVSGPEKAGLILINDSKGAIERTFFTIFSAREHWNGPISLYNWGLPDESLTVACSRFGVTLFEMGNGRNEATKSGAKHRIESIIAGSEYQQGILLHSGTLILRSMEDLASSANTQSDDHEWLAKWGERPLMINETGIRYLDAVHANDFNSCSDASLLLCLGSETEWSDEAWQTWCEYEERFLAQITTPIRTPKGATIVTIVTADQLDGFHKCVPGWRFTANTPILLVLVGIEKDSVWLPSWGSKVQILQVPIDRSTDTPWILGKIAETCDTEAVIFLPSSASALPGAELWIWHGIEEVHLHAPVLAQKETSVTGNEFVSEPFCGMLPRRRLREIAQAATMTNRQWDSPSLLISECLEAEEIQYFRSDVHRMGWVFSDKYCYKAKRSPSTVLTLETKSGPWKHLAEEVVVISLPEREDRRRRICEMMEREAVPFRFVDGIRVTYDEISPLEIAEVGWEPSKLVAGREKYLCGMTGCRRAHLRCLEDAFARGLRSLLILEDDVVLKEGWAEKYEAALAELPPGWLQLYLSAADFRVSTRISPHLRRLSGAYQTTAILYSELGIQAALQCISKSRHEVDSWLARHLHPFGGSYAVEPGITHQDGGVSDIMSFYRGVTS